MTAPSQLCAVCHRYPAQLFTIRRHVGMLVMQRFVSLKRPLCREHARELNRAYTLQTLWQGWWGYISFFVNWFVLASNLAVHVRAGRLAAPQPVPQVSPQVVVPPV